MSEYTDIMDSEQPQENVPVANTAATVCQQIYTELRKVFIGQDHVVSQVLAALL